MGIYPCPTPNSDLLTLASVSESPPICQYGNYKQFDASLACNLIVRLSFPENRDMIVSNLRV